MLVHDQFKIPGLLEFKRTVICNPVDESFFSYCIKSPDIILLTSEYIPETKAVYSNDCNVEFKPQIGWVANDFENNDFTIKTNYIIT